MAGGYSIKSLDTKLPTPTSYTCAVGVGTNIYLFGGSTAVGSLDSIYKFDTETKTITLLETKLPAATANITGVTDGAKIYLCGEDLSSRYYLWVFDPDTESITDTGLLLPNYNSTHKPVIRPDGTTIYYSGHGAKYRYAITLSSLSIGTNGTDYSYLTDEMHYCGGSLYHVGVLRYDALKNGYLLVASNGGVISTVNSVNTISAVVGTKLYIFGGCTATVLGSARVYGDYHTSIRVYDPTINKLLELSVKLPYAVSTLNTIATVGEKIYLFGGYDSTNKERVDTILEFDTNSQTIVTYNGSTITTIGQETKATLVCGGKKAVGDIVVDFDVDGSITYDGVTTDYSQGQTVTLPCAGKKMRTNVVVDCYSAEST